MFMITVLRAFTLKQKITRFFYLEVIDGYLAHSDTDVNGDNCMYIYKAVNRRGALYMYIDLASKQTINEYHWYQTLGAVRFILLTIFINSGTYYNIIIRIHTYAWCALINITAYSRTYCRL